MNKQVTKIRLKKGDSVVVLSGKYKGKVGKVLSTHPTTNQVTVEGVNIVKKHVKPNRQYPQGGIIDITKPLPVSKVGILDPATKKPTRVAYSFNKEGQKVRVYASSKKEIN